MRADVLGIGCCAVDDVLYLAHHPAADSKLEVRKSERRCGGLTAVALMAVAQLGGVSRFAGVLGDDELSQYVVRAMADCAVDTSSTIHQPDARPAHAIILVDESTASRTILYDVKHVLGADPELRPDLIQSTRVLLVDHFGVPGTIRACRIAREAAIPIVADFEADHDPRFHEMLALADHLILSKDFAMRITGHGDPAVAARALWSNARSAVIVTAGKAGCWCLDSALPDRPTHVPAFEVLAADTTGCGDVFHGAYAFALACGMPLSQRLRLASAAAALRAQRACGPHAVPTMQQVERFLEHRVES